MGVGGRRGRARIIAALAIFVVLTGVFIAVASVPVYDAMGRLVSPTRGKAFSDGTCLVGTDIEPGTYKSQGGSSCYWERLRGFGHTTEEIIANGNDESSVLVSIARTDKGFHSDG